MLDVQLERRVVVKTLTSLAAKKAFFDEVNDLVRVSKHPNIVSIYESLLSDQLPHYVREYVEGRSLRDRLDNGGPADLTIDFVHQVLSAVGEAMAFAMKVKVWDLGIEPEKVLIRNWELSSRRGLPADYHVVICPGPGGSDFIQSGESHRDGEWRELYVPPEYKRSDQMSLDPDKANQYRLGILGYELLVGSKSFREQANRREPFDRWIPVNTVNPSLR
jgi:serine/threonine-protein kinase